MTLGFVSRTIASVLFATLLGFILLVGPVSALPPPLPPYANCTWNGEGYTCTVVANNTAVTLPFLEQTDGNATAYVVFCAYDTPCAANDASLWSYVLAFTNVDNATTALVYVNAQPGVSNPDFCDASGYCISTIADLAPSTCFVYGYCPGYADPNGDATFTDGTNTVNIVPNVPVVIPPITDPCTVGIYCDTSVIVWNGPAGTQVTLLATKNTPNEVWTMPSAGSYGQLVPVDQLYFYSATLPNGSTVTGNVTSPGPYETVTVSL